MTLRRLCVRDEVDYYLESDLDEGVKDGKLTFVYDYIGEYDDEYRPPLLLDTEEIEDQANEFLADRELDHEYEAMEYIVEDIEIKTIYVLDKPLKCAKMSQLEQFRRSRLTVPIRKKVKKAKHESS